MLIVERKMPKRRRIALAVAGLVALIAVLPLARAYLDARQVVGERGRAEAMGFSARMYNYLAPPEPNLLYGDVFHRFTDNERRLFPGFVAVALSLLRLWARKHQNTTTPNHPVTNSRNFAVGPGAVI